MNENINISLRDIEGFNSISDYSIQELKNDLKPIRYKLGMPICDTSNIPNKIIVIVSGEARVVNGQINSCELISKLGAQEFIGLASLINARGCELISASTELIGLSFSDKLIIKLYKEEESFREWCNQKIHLSEINQLANHLYNDIADSNISIQTLSDILSKNIRVKTYKNDEFISNNTEIKNYLISDNVNDSTIFDILDQQKISTRGPFPARIFELNKAIYANISKPKSTSKKPSEDNINLNKSLKSEDKMLDISSEKVGQYNTEKNIKLIKGQGDLREALACLQMLASEINLPYRSDSIEKILRDALNRGKKPNLQLLGGITSIMGLHSTIAKVPKSEASRIPYPSIIAWKNSFALVKETNSLFLEIISPNKGIIRLDTNNLDDSFNDGFIELLLVEKNDQTPNIKFGLSWLLPAINRYRGVLLQVLLASFIAQLFGLANPLLIQVVIDKVISQRSLDTLQILGIALIVITVLGGVISSLRTFLFNETTNRIDSRLGSEVIDHLLRIPLGYFDKRPVGELGSRIAELEKIRNFLTGQALTTILDAAFSVIYIIIMALYSWLLTIVALIVVPIQIFITIIGAPLIRRQIREVAQRNAKTQSHLVEILTGIQTVKAQNIENVSRWKWQELYGSYISKSFQKTITGTSLNEISQVLQQISQLLVLWIGAGLVLNGKLTLGQLIAFRIISGYVTQPLLRLSTIWQNIQELKVSFERLADIIDTPEESSEVDKAKIPLPSLKGLIEFKNVEFKFNQNSPNVLNNINLTIKPGQFVGIVGQSGSGKSTLMKLLPRLYKPNEGKILIDGYDINKVELYSLRRQIGIVPQEPLLFAGNISSNISLIDPEAPSDEIVRVAKISNAHDFIMSLSEGYSTDIGERGAGLSGGQKQRLAIARTLLSNPKLLILDEATSALDYQTERKVCEGLREACKESTVFFITHRLNTVKNADVIVMLHDGCISEVGTHDKLMELKGRYFALYRQQDAS
ncbi:ATPase [Prochlorococcus marinus str. NATL2A]|uniref:ATPase n=1 Tax=Prochlorococcus marinus (strain NATL2A) TaxID=59920 RepID=Q46IG4_PROMT|nr:peptidase domain-containing ABC transporter [Prochlorococcus marinus]AAZ58714.1 ATPase [Prochlorococcus marinus str. NATL2A]